MHKSCSDTFTSCYTRNGNIKVKLKTSKKLVTVTSPGDLFKHGIGVDYEQMVCVAKHLTSNPTAKVQGVSQLLKQNGSF